MFSPSFKSQKLRVNLRLAINRLKLLEKKKTEIALKARKEIADYLQQSKVDRARIRVEHIIREDYLVEAMELLEMYCDLLLARMGLVETMKFCEEGLVEAVSTLIWAAPRLQSDVAELKVVQEQLTLKYGKDFAEQAMKNTHQTVNERFIIKMSPNPPPKILVENYLVEIARNYNVPFEPDQSVMLSEGIPSIDSKEFDVIGSDFRGPGMGPSGPPGGGSGPGHIGFGPGPYGPGGGSGGVSLPDVPNVPTVPHPSVPGSGMGSASGGSQAPYPPAGQKSYPPPGINEKPIYPPPSYSAPPYPANVNGPSAPAATGPPKGLNSMPDLPQVPTNSLPPTGGNSQAPSHNGGGGDVDFDDLTRRFEELKKKK